MLLIDVINIFFKISIQYNSLYIFVYGLTTNAPSFLRQQDELVDRAPTLQDTAPVLAAEATISEEVRGGGL